MEFKATLQDDRRTIEREAIISFLSSVDTVALGREVLESMGWDDGDPVSNAIKVLLERAEQW